MGQALRSDRADKVPLRERVLTAIARGAITHSELAQRIHRTISPTLAELSGTGLIARNDDDGTYSITDAGRIALRTKDA